MDNVGHFRSYSLLADVVFFWIETDDVGHRGRYTFSCRSLDLKLESALFDHDSPFLDPISVNQKSCQSQEKESILPVNHQLS